MCLSRLGSLSLEGDDLQLYLLRTGVPTRDWNRSKKQRRLNNFTPITKLKKKILLCIFRTIKLKCFFYALPLFWLFLVSSERGERIQNPLSTQFVFSVFTTVLFRFFIACVCFINRLFSTVPTNYICIEQCVPCCLTMPCVELI